MLRSYPACRRSDSNRVRPSDARNSHAAPLPARDPTATCLHRKSSRVTSPSNRRSLHFLLLIPKIEESEYHRSEEHTSELQSLMRISYAVFCLNKKKSKNTQSTTRP